MMRQVEFKCRAALVADGRRSYLYKSETYPTTQEVVMEDNGHVAYRSYIDALLDQLKTRADLVVLRYQKSDVTGDALRRAVFRYARTLEALGIGRDSLVAQFASNCPDALAIRYAANLLGAGTMFLPALVDADRRTVLLERIQPTFLVVFAQTAQLVSDAVNTRVVYVGGHPDDP
jgi:fatty-acyl-CoA synthase